MNRSSADNNVKAFRNMGIPAIINHVQNEFFRGYNIQLRPGIALYSGRQCKAAIAYLNNRYNPNDAIHYRVGKLFTFPHEILAWENGTVVAIADKIHDDSDSEAMGILGDALEEAGVTDVDILTHCRSAQHFRGSWVVDLLTNKGSVNALTKGQVAAMKVDNNKKPVLFEKVYNLSQDSPIKKPAIFDNLLLNDPNVGYADQEYTILRINGSIHSAGTGSIHSALQVADEHWPTVLRPTTNREFVCAIEAGYIARLIFEQMPPS